MKTLKKYSEFISIPLAILVWWNSQFIIRYFDPIATVDDAGLLQRLFFAFAGLFFFHGFTKIIMKMNWSTLDDYLQNDFSNDFKTITAWQKIQLSAFIFCFLLIALVLLF